ncbi:MAG TPA: hypothetical protein VNI78_06305, partial [Vicinamibacterales bacterium]|nr:hypothetical protein [Vicinamibacterales bacterium]
MRTLPLAGVLLAAGVAVTVPSAQQTAVVFERVNVIPMDRERVLADQTVVTSGGRIAAIGPAAQVTVPPGA